MIASTYGTAALHRMAHGMHMVTPPLPQCWRLQARPGVKHMAVVGRAYHSGMAPANQQMHTLRGFSESLPGLAKERL